MEPWRVLTHLFFQGLHQLNEGQRVSIEIVRERRPFGDGRRFDFQDVSQTIADKGKNSGTVEHYGVLLRCDDTSQRTLTLSLLVSAYLILAMTRAQR